MTSANGNFETRLKYLNRAMAHFHFSKIYTLITCAQPREKLDAVNA